jgi:uncharacterized tellurite resistance protein B-like protein
MFLWRLNDTQRKVFMALATRMAMADAKVPPEEVRLLDDFAASLETDIKSSGEAIFAKPDLSAFDTHESRTIMVLGILAVALSDNHFHVDESSVLTQITNTFDISPQKLAELRMWAERIVDVYHDFHKFIESNDAV